MNARQIEEVIKKDPVTRNKFGGVFAENRLPHHVNVYPCGFIANTDPDSKPGKHWVAFYFTTPEQGEFYGHSPHFYSKRFLNFLNQNSQNWICNQEDLQSLNTAVCGEYSIFYLMHRARGVSMNSIVNLFGSNKLWNDESVYFFISKYLR